MSFQLVLHQFYLVYEQLPLRGVLTDGEAVVVTGSGADEVVQVVGTAGHLLAVDPDPFHERVLDEHIAVVNNQMHLLPQGLVAGQHAPFEGAFQTKGLGQINKAFGKSEGNQFGDGQLHTGAEGIAKVNHDQRACRGLYQEILEMAIAYAKDVGDQGDG